MSAASTSRVMSALLLVLAGVAAACVGTGSNMKGTYSDPSGAFILDLRSGGKAMLTFSGESTQCGYTVADRSVNLDCPEPAGKLALAVHDDGSLTGPPGTAMPQLRKSK